MVVYQRKSHQRAAALSLVDGRCSSLVVLPDAAPSSSAALPPLEGSSLDPASGDLDAARAARKRQQISSLAAHALAVVDEIGAGARVVEFGAGSGHLGLLVDRELLEVVRELGARGPPLDRVHSLGPLH